ncbi:armadillo-type protein [Naematelia encephala]|uniref:Armadillo-type protein n=1 Tax=Naematelia encephala TaxID=71784 RepID=A0A1Y2BDX7_9TREE|nr:armadillo-type protein [Naematelia encephala]
MSSADYVAKYSRRRALRDKVETYWLEEAKRPAGSLDSSLKKHTTLLNRLKSSLLTGPSDALVKEIDGLTLTKYLEEIASAIVEGATKGKGDPDVAVDVIAHLHTRLTPDFLPLLLPQLLSILTVPTPSASAAKDGEKDREKEDKERIIRQRPVLRIVAELAMIHAWPEGPVKGIQEVHKLLRALMTGDPQYTNYPLLAYFLKYFGRAYLGPQETTQPSGEGVSSNGVAHATEESDALPEGVEELVPKELQVEMRKTFVGYFNSASKTLVKGQIKLLEQDKRNHEAYIKSGEIFEDRQHAYERMTKAVERLTLGVNNLADLLGLSPPTLPTAASLSKQGLQIVETSSSFTVRDDPVNGGIWDDEEEKRFYEDLVDLKEVVPAGLLGIKDKKPPTKPGELTANGTTDSTDHTADGQADAKAQAVQKQVQEDIQRQLAQLEVNGESTVEPEPTSIAMSRSATETSVDSNVQRQLDEDTPDPDATPLAEVHPEDDGLQTGPAARLTALFAALPDAVNRELVDKLAVEFAFLNSKAARNRLIKFIAEVPKDRTDLLPHYSRFVATLDRYMPDIGTGIVELLDDEMRYLQRKKMIRELDGVRLKNVRFFGELAKFQVAKPYAILHVLKVFLDDFKHNIENIANLLETCGRFLLRYEGTAETAKQMVELMRRKQGTQHLDARQQVMLENAFYQCNPPERVAREVIELTPMQAFIQHLLHDVLMKRTLDKVLKLMRKLHWEDQETYDYILHSFTEIWEIKFGNIPYVAALVYDLQRYHMDFGIAIVDQVLEDIRVGMEENIFKYNQRRISTLKYLGELYMYRVVNAAVIFDVLWSLLSFGHGEGLPVPGRDSPIDAVDDFFRVRLVCTLLDTCGSCFDRGSQRRKLDHFLVVFQLYVTCKSEIPMDVEFMLSDTLDALRPKAPRLKTFAEAAAAVDELLGAQAQDGSEDGNGRAEEMAEMEDDDEPSAPMAVSEDDEADDVVLIRSKEQKQDEHDVEAAADFDREFAKMLADTTDARRGDRKNAPPIFDTAVPHIKKASTQEPGTDEGKMAFTLLSKRGNRQQMRSLDVPVDSAMALNIRTHQLQSKAEQEQLKRLVLQNERRQERSELHGQSCYQAATYSTDESLALEQEIGQRGIKMRIVKS